MSIKITRVQLESITEDRAWVRDHLGGRGSITLEGLATMHPPESTRTLFERHGMKDVVYSRNVDLPASEPNIAPVTQEVSDRLYDDTGRLKIEELRAKHRDLKKDALVDTELMTAAAIGAMAMIYDQKKEADRQSSEFMGSVSSGMLAGWLGQMAFNLIRKKKEEKEK